MPDILPGVVRDAVATMDHHIGLDHKDDLKIVAAWYTIRHTLITYSHDRMQLLLEMQDFRDHANIPHEEPVDGQS